MSPAGDGPTPAAGGARPAGEGATPTTGGARPAGEGARPVAENEDGVEQAGHFRIYLGAAAGVGKTCAMLDEGRRRRNRGTDVVVGFAEDHGRPHTTGMLAEQEIIPRRSVTYRGTSFEEMDLDAVLARRPAVALVDELAHTNVPGSGAHTKRWEDVIALLDAGIDVVTTVNIQHLESIADAVEEMTGTTVRERVPDWVIRRADQIELVDSSPESLRRRMIHGNIYPAAKVPQALTNFFRTDNLIALRELALRFLADESDDDLLEHLRRQRPDRVWETSERIMVAVTTAPGTDGLLRRAARLASRVHAPLHVLHVTRSDASVGGGDQVAALRLLANKLGSTWHEEAAEEPAAAMLAFAQEHQITQIVIGSTSRSRWQELVGGGSIARKVLADAGAAGIDVHVIARRQASSAGPVDPVDGRATGRG